MKYYIVNQKKGYYVSYKDKCNDNYSDDYITAKKYKTLPHALNRANFYYKDNVNQTNQTIKEIDYKINNSRIAKLKKLNYENVSVESLINYIDILENFNRIEIIEIIGNKIKHLGKLKNIEIYNLIKKELDKNLKEEEEKLQKLQPFLTEKDKKLLLSETRTAAQEEIDDFCF